MIRTTLPQIEDITGRFDAVNPADRMYRCTRGYTIKIRVTDISATPGQLVFRVTGSWADDATGRAKVMEGLGPFVAGVHEIVIASETATEVAEHLDAARMKVVGQVSLAAANHYAREALSGVRARSTH